MKVVELKLRKKELNNMSFLKILLLLAMCFIVYLAGYNQGSNEGYYEAINHNPQCTGRGF